LSKDEVGPVHRHDGFSFLANGLTNQWRENSAQVDAGVAQQAIDLLGGVLGFQPVRLRQRQADRRNRHGRRIQHAEHAVAQGRDPLGVQFAVKPLANPLRNHIRPEIPHPHRRPRDPKITAFGASIMALI
jgi:hypothetical protein